MGQEEVGGGAGSMGQSPTALDFGAGRALRLRTTAELGRALLVLGLCGVPPLVTHAGTLFRVSRRLLGARLWGRLLGATFYGQFVGGATPGEVWGTARRLRAVGLSPMLALPLEGDVGPESEGEQWFEANRGAALECVGLAAAMGPEPMMQLKVTALMSAQLCEKLSLLGEEEELADKMAAGMGGEEPQFPALTAAEHRHLWGALRRLEEVAERAVCSGVTLLVDAEQSYLRGALGGAVLALMGRHNREAPWVWNTQQAYLRDAPQRLARGAEAARRRGARYGVKLVRGAYLELERSRARSRGEPDPLLPHRGATHGSYGQCLELALQLVRREGAGLMVATHNELSVLAAARRMEEMGVAKRGGGVCFGQLLGMGDHISLALGQAGYRVYKSVPLGGAEATLPYLARRAHENRAALRGARAEARLVAAELRRRLLRAMGVGPGPHDRD